jgi:uncharacterized protein (TIGR00725 family)
MENWIRIRRPPVVIGVMGSHEEGHCLADEALRLGGEIARRGYVLLTGGGTGLMKAASEGAWRAGGLVLGILPNDRRTLVPGYPNEFVDIPVFTGMREARNVINAKTPHILVALSGGLGTLSEIAIAVRAGTPVIGLHSPPVASEGPIDFTAAETVEEVLALIERKLGVLQGRP